MSRTLTTRAQAILDKLESGPANVHDLRRTADSADDRTFASFTRSTTVRRIIQDLRRAGHNIVATLPGSPNSRYELRASNQGDGATV